MQALNKIQFMLNNCMLILEFKNETKKRIEYFLKNDVHKETNLLIINKILDIYKIINTNSRVQFISFLPLIFKTFNFIGILNFSSFKKKLKSLIINNKDYTFMT